MPTRLSEIARPGAPRRGLAKRGKVPAVRGSRGPPGARSRGHELHAQITTPYPGGDSEEASDPAFRPSDHDRPDRAIGIVQTG